MAAEQGFSSARHYAVSIDVGGTFTDFVLFDIDAGTIVAFHKVLTELHQPASAVLAGWQDLALTASRSTPHRVEEVIHSTTLISNAIVERRGAATALITTRGFRDVLEVGSEQMYDIFDLFAPYPEPLVPRYLRREVGERVSRNGTVLQALDKAEVSRLVAELLAEGIGSIAVCLLHAYRNSGHEERLGRIIAETAPNVSFSLSSRVAPLMGEYDRSSTTVADAYVKPIVQHYLSSLAKRLNDHGYAGPVRMVLSSGGITTLEAAAESPIRLLESGPAAGSLAAAYYGRLTGYDAVLSFDMGGTTAKACLIEAGVPTVTGMLEVARLQRFKPGSGLPIMTPSVDLIEIGAGGGSIAHVNTLDLLNVGPESAGATPGPVCYGLGGTEPTVTDANVVLGYLDPAYFLGGTMPLDAGLARQAVKTRIASRLGITPMRAAWGIHAIVNENMARAARTHIIERNQDPRDLVLIAFGGAGPAHAVSVARILGISTVVVPLGAGVASAIGALTAPIALPLARSNMTTLRACDWEVVQHLYDDMRGEALRALGPTHSGSVTFRYAVDLRFAGQYHELQIPVEIEGEGAALLRAIEQSFNERYTEVYGRVPPGLPVEALNWHLTAEAPRWDFTLAAQDGVEGDSRVALKGQRQAWFDGDENGIFCAVYDRYRLTPTTTVAGPCLIEEREATAVVPPGASARVDAYQNLIVRIRQSGVGR